MRSQFLCVMGAVFGLLGLAGPVQAQFAQTGPVSVIAPAWQPLSSVPTAHANSYKPGVPAPAASPYYTDSLRMRQGAIRSFIANPLPVPTASMPMITTPTVTSIRPTVVPDQMITPFVQTPNGLVRGTVAPSAMPVVPSATVSVPPTTMPSVASVPAYVPIAPTVPPAPATTPQVTVPPPAPEVAQTPAPPTETAPTPAEPLVDSNVFIPTGQSWMDIDITPYISRFPAGSGAERSVRDWILRQTGTDTWNNAQVSSLVVTPERVRVYHTKAVQEDVRGFLGRLVNYSPGEFPCQVRVIGVRDATWKRRYNDVLRPAGQNGTSGQLWLVNAEDAAVMINDLGNARNGQVLTTPDAVAYNGQPLTVDWSPTVGRKSDPRGTGRPTEDGVLLTFNPLIDVDAATIEMDLSASLRREVTAKDSFWQVSRARNQPAITERQVRDLVKIAPGQVALVNLGEIPSFDDRRGLLGREKFEEVLIFLACQPSPNNEIMGRRVDLAAVQAAARRSISASPIEQPRATGLQASQSPPSPASVRARARERRGMGLSFVPSALTAPVD